MAVIVHQTAQACGLTKYWLWLSLLSSVCFDKFPINWSKKTKTKMFKKKNVITGELFIPNCHCFIDVSNLQSLLWKELTRTNYDWLLVQVLVCIWCPISLFSTQVQYIFFTCISLFPSPFHVLPTFFLVSLL